MKTQVFCLLLLETDGEHTAQRAETVAIGWEDFKEALRFLEEGGGTVEVKEGGDTRAEMDREEEGQSDTGRSRTSSGSTRLRFVFKST